MCLSFPTPWCYCTPSGVGVESSPCSPLQGGLACRARGEPQYLETFRAGADPGTILSALVAQLVDRLGDDGFWKGDYGWGVRVRSPFGARGMSSVRYGTRLGDLKNKQSTHTPAPRPRIDIAPGPHKPLNARALAKNLNTRATFRSSQPQYLHIPPHAHLHY